MVMVRAPSRNRLGTHSATRAWNLGKGRGGKGMEWEQREGGKRDREEEGKGPGRRGCEYLLTHTWHVLELRHGLAEDE